MSCVDSFVHSTSSSHRLLCRVQPIYYEYYIIIMPSNTITNNTHMHARSQDLQRFCCDNGFGVWVVPADVVPEAPRKTKSVLGFDPPGAAGASSRRSVESGGWRGLEEIVFSPSPSSSPSEEEEKSVLTPEDVRKWRADFERLYAQDE